MIGDLGGNGTMKIPYVGDICDLCFRVASANEQPWYYDRVFCVCDKCSAP